MSSTTQAAIRARGLSKRVGATDALSDLDLEVRSGEVMGYLGPNGAGKTTTIRLLLGLIAPTAGRAEIFGVDCHTDPVAAHRRLADVPGEASLWPGLTGAETRISSAVSTVRSTDHTRKCSSTGWPSCGRDGWPTSGR